MKTMLYKEAVLLAKINILILLLNCSNGEKTTKRYMVMTHYIQNNVYVYFRYTDNKTVMILMNNSNEIKLSKLPVSRKA
jgi:hypothetical protein